MDHKILKQYADNINRTRYLEDRICKATEEEHDRAGTLLHAQWWGEYEITNQSLINDLFEHARRMDERSSLVRQMADEWLEIVGNT